MLDKENKYFTVRSTHTKGMTFSMNMETDKRKKAIVEPIEIKGSFPHPNPKMMTPGKSYFNEAQKEALEREEVWNLYVKEGKFAVTEIQFKDLPEELQKLYDIKLYQKLKAKAAG